MRQDYIIRKATSADAEQWIKLNNLVCRKAYQDILPTRVFDENESTEKVSKAIANFNDIILAADRISYVVEVDHQIVGLMSGVTKSHYDYWGRQNYADLERIYLHPDYQHAGLGKQLFDIFVAALKQHKLNKFVIGAFAANQQARRAYAKWGGKLSDYTELYCKHGVNLPEVFYTYQIGDSPQQMSLVQVGARTYYLKNATNIGIYLVDAQNVYLIDTGNDKDAGKKIMKIIAEQGWQIKGIVNTHSHADHIGGNQIIQSRTNCAVYAHSIECHFVSAPILEPSMLYGGYPLPDLQNKFLLAQPSTVQEIDGRLPAGLSYVVLPGHSPNMIGIRTSDDVIFLGDAVFNETTLNKYHFFYLYDVAAFLQTLNTLENMSARWFIPAHGTASNDIQHLIALNRAKVNELCDAVVACCQDSTFEEILKTLFDRYQLHIDANQYVLIGSTVRSYLAYLVATGKIKYYFQNNQMLWIKN